MNEIFIALIGLLSGLIGAFIGARTANQKNYSQTVSMHRLDWMDNLYDDIGVMLGAIEVLRNANTEEEKNKYNYKYNKARALVLSKLNRKEDKHQIMFMLIVKLDNFKDSYSDKEYFAVKESILESMSQVGKEVWETVKQETKLVGGKTSV
ncbi:MAG: hypothetical protein FWE23_11405 [Chitinivibrionia bacterium]|nr:hypothetical protein [Chitinivibrionia bacterium]